jgi:hypothetical protein
MTEAQAITAAKKLAKKLGVRYTSKPKFNRYGGLSSGNGDRVICIKFDKDKNLYEVVMICTCYNCGDGQWVNLTNLI